MADQLLDKFKNSILEMQTQMQSAYTDMSKIRLVGKSHDGSVVITMSGTYSFEDIEFDKKALEGGLREFRWRVREAWKDLSEKIQKTTQSKTMELLQNMPIPDEIKSLSADAEKESGEEY